MRHQTSAYTHSRCMAGFSTIQAVYDTSSAETFILEVKTTAWEVIEGAKNYILFLKIV